MEKSFQEERTRILLRQPVSARGIDLRRQRRGRRRRGRVLIRQVLQRVRKGGDDAAAATATATARGGGGSQGGGPGPGHHDHAHSGADKI